MHYISLLVYAFGVWGATQSDFSANDAHISSLQSEGFTTLNHDKFPGHGVRIKKSNFCDPTVNVYTGYLDVDYGAKHLFFYFFESRRKPDEDDVMMWINGGKRTRSLFCVLFKFTDATFTGPGASSSMGLLMELGPCNIDMDPNTLNGTTWNPYSWSEAANIFFLDQPVGVGFSYAEYGETVETTEEAAKNIHAFVTIFFETFKQFTGRKLHLSGESYGGRYLPVFASEIYDQNTIAQGEGRPTINLGSVIIGNGITDISTLYEGRYQIECSTAALDVPFQSISTCVRMKTALPRCQAAMKASCIDLFDDINCRAAVNFCDSELSTGMWATGRNVYDISKPCIGTFCYRESTYISDLLNDPKTRAALGIPTSFPGNFSSSSGMVASSFAAHMDKWRFPNHFYVASLLERGVPVLIYAGTYDWQCNWVANRLWVEKLEWERGEEWRGSKEGWREWFLSNGTDAKPAGVVKTTGLLTFATVKDAGHMISLSFNRLRYSSDSTYVPHDKPAEALKLIQYWLGKEKKL